MSRLLKYLIWLLLLISVPGLWQLRWNSNILALLPDVPSRQDIQEYNRVFSSLDRFSITLVGDNRNQLIAAAEDAAGRLRQHRFFQDSSAQFTPQRQLGELRDFYERQLPNLLTTAELNQVTPRLERAYIEKRMQQIFEVQIGVGSGGHRIREDPLQLTQIFWQRLQNFGSIGGKRYEGYLLAANQSALLLRVSGTAAHLDTAQAKECWEFIDKVILELRRKYPTVTMIAIGGKRVAMDNAEVIRRDVAVVSTVALVSLLVLLLLVLRNWRVLPLILIPLAFGIIVATGITALLAPQISLITLGLGAVLLGISIDYVIHYLIHLEQQSDPSPDSVIRQLIKPMSFAALSTAGALAVLSLSSFPAHVEIGYFVGSGILASFVFVAGVFPALCRWLYLKQRQPAAAYLDLPKLLARFDRQLSRPVFHAAVMVLTIGVSVLALWQLPRLQFVNQLERFNYRAPDTRRAEQRFFEIWGDQRGKIAIVAQGKSLEKAISNNYELMQILRTAQKKGQVQLLTPTSELLIPLSQMRQCHRLWRAYWTEARQRQLQQNFTEAGQRYGFSPQAFAPFFTMIAQPSQPQAIAALYHRNPAWRQILGQQIAQANGKWYIQNIIQAQDPAVMTWLSRQIKQQLPAPLIIDRRAMLREIDVVLAQQTLQTAAIAAGVVLLLFLAYFIHIELVLAAFVPLALSLLWILGAMAFLDIPLNIFNTLIIVFVLGLGIDYATFRTSCYLATIGRNDTAVCSTRAAIILSAATTICGFGALVFAKHPALFSLGGSVVIGITIVAFHTLFLTPIILRFFIPPGRRSHPIHLYHIVSSLWAFGWFISSIVVLATTVFPVIAWWQHWRGRRDDKVYRRLIEALNRFLLVTNPLGTIRLIGFPERRRIQGCIAVVNHCNTSDIPLFNAMPFDKVTLVKWFWKLPLVGKMLQRAGFFPVSPERGPDQQPMWFGHYRRLLTQGCNILFFPEGTRAKSMQMKRFRVGAFKLACATDAPILPICFFNTRWVISRSRLIVRDYELYASALPMLTPATYDYSRDHRAMARDVQALIAEEYERLSKQKACERQQVRLVRDCYRYLSPYYDVQLAWRTWRDPGYVRLPRLLPRSGKILDIGCGSGFLSNLLLYSGERRQVVGIDHDPEQIDLAQRSLISYTAEAITFIKGNLATDPGDQLAANQFAGAVCCDLLATLPPSQQRQVLAVTYQLLATPAVLVISQKHSQNTWELAAQWIQWLLEFGFSNIHSPLSREYSKQRLTLVASKTNSRIFSC